MSTFLTFIRSTIWWAVWLFLFSQAGSLLFRALDWPGGLGALLVPALFFLYACLATKYSPYV